MGAASATLTFAGYAGADEGAAAQFVVNGRPGAGDRLEEAGYEVRHELAAGRVYVVRGPADGDLERVPGVESAGRDVKLRLAEPDVEDRTADVQKPLFYDDLQWDKQNTESLEANGRATGASTEVAVIDTGIDYAHPELDLDEGAGRLFRASDVRSGVGEVVVPDDYDAPTELTTAEFHVADDQQGHGTHVGGIAASSAGGGVIGTAPEATLVSLRVFWWAMVFDEDGQLVPAVVTTTGDVLAAIDHAAERGYDAANLSLGTSPIHPNAMREESIRTIRVAYERVVGGAVRRGTVVVSSAGNDATNLGRRGLFSLPNSVEGALSVSATAPNDELSFYSDYGISELDVGAPGGGYEGLIETLCGVEEWVLAGGPLPDGDPREEGDESRVCFDEAGNVVLDEDEAEECFDCLVPEWPYPFNFVFSTTSPRVEGAAYGWKLGTSMAAPQVSGLVALVRELDPDANPREVESAIERGAEGATGKSDPELGAGRINALNTVEEGDE